MNKRGRHDCGSNQRETMFGKMLMTTRVSNKRYEVALEGNVRVLKYWTHVIF